MIILGASIPIFISDKIIHYSGQVGIQQQVDIQRLYKSSIANKSEVNKFLHFIIKGLDKKGFLQPEHKRQSMIRNINNIFHRLNLSEQEIRILLGIFTTLNEFNRKT